MDNSETLFDCKGLEDQHKDRLGGLERFRGMRNTLCRGGKTCAKQIQCFKRNQSLVCLARVVLATCVQ